MLVSHTKPGGVPHRLLEVILEIFEVLGGLGRFGRILKAVLHFMDGLAELLSDYWAALEGCWEV